MQRQTVCRACTRRAPLSVERWRCECGGLLDLEAGPRFDPGRVEAETWSLWRYRHVLPVGPEGWRGVTLGEGCTPLVAPEPGRPDLLAKLDFLLPTLSFKDRGAAVLVTAAAELGAVALIADSSGNAGTAIAAYAARAGIPCTVYVPATTPTSKLGQARRHGASVIAVPGSREDAAAAARQATGAPGVLYASHVWNPLFFEGTKTLAHELAEQRGWRLPERVVLPVGNGTLVLGAHLGFAELAAAGIGARRPVIIAVQAEACAPIAAAFGSGAERVSPTENRGTIAEGIAIAAPPRGDQVLEVVRASGGALVTVSDAQTRDARRRLAARGIDVEPTAAAAWAATLALPAGDGVTITVLSGAGLKSG